VTLATSAAAAVAASTERIEALLMKTSLGDVVFYKFTTRIGL